MIRLGAQLAGQRPLFLAFGLGQRPFQVESVLTFPFVHGLLGRQTDPDEQTHLIVQIIQPFIQPMGRFAQGQAAQEGVRVFPFSLPNAQGCTRPVLPEAEFPICLHPLPQPFPLVDQRFVNHLHTFLAAPVLAGDNQPRAGQFVDERPVLVADFQPGGDAPGIFHPFAGMDQLQQNATHPFPFPRRHAGVDSIRIVGQRTADFFDVVVGRVGDPIACALFPEHSQGKLEQGKLAGGIVQIVQNAFDQPRLVFHTVLAGRLFDGPAQVLVVHHPQKDDIFVGDVGKGAVAEGLAHKIGPQGDENRHLGAVGFLPFGAGEKRGQKEPAHALVFAQGKDLLELVGNEHYPFALGLLRGLHRVAPGRLTDDLAQGSVLVLQGRGHIPSRAFAVAFREERLGQMKKGVAAGPKGEDAPGDDRCPLMGLGCQQSRTQPRLDDRRFAAARWPGEQHEGLTLYGIGQNLDNRLPPVEVVRVVYAKGSQPRIGAAHRLRLLGDSPLGADALVHFGQGRVGLFPKFRRQVMAQAFIEVQGFFPGVGKGQGGHQAQGGLFQPGAQGQMLSGIFHNLSVGAQLHRIILQCFQRGNNAGLEGFPGHLQPFVEFAAVDAAEVRQKRPGVKFHRLGQAFIAAGAAFGIRVGVGGALLQQFQNSAPVDPGMAGAQGNAIAADRQERSPVFIAERLAQAHKLRAQICACVFTVGPKQDSQTLPGDSFAGVHSQIGQNGCGLARRQGNRLSVSGDVQGAEQLN